MPYYRGRGYGGAWWVAVVAALVFAELLRRWLAGTL
jgi:hypothetical protein